MEEIIDYIDIDFIEFFITNYDEFEDGDKTTFKNQLIEFHKKLKDIIPEQVARNYSQLKFPLLRSTGGKKRKKHSKRSKKHKKKVRNSRRRYR